MLIRALPKNMGLSLLAFFKKQKRAKQIACLVLRQKAQYLMRILNHKKNPDFIIKPGFSNQN